MSGFKCSCFCPRLGQETLTWRSIRGGEETVLKNFSDNTVLTVCHFSFCFPFYFSRPDIEGFFFLDQIFYPSSSIHFWLVAQVFYCRSLCPVCLYPMSMCVRVLGCWCSFIELSKRSHSWLSEVLTDRELLFLPKVINNQWECIVSINRQR